MQTIDNIDADLIIARCHCCCYWCCFAPVDSGAPTVAADRSTAVAAVAAADPDHRVVDQEMIDESAIVPDRCCYIKTANADPIVAATIRISWFRCCCFVAAAAISDN